MNRVTSALVLVLLLASLFVPLGVPQGSGAVAGLGQAPWWPDPDLPVSQFREGWNLRIPLRVSHDTFRPQGTPVQVHLDLAQSILEGGWPGHDNSPDSFRAYPESVNLVEYDGWGTIRGEVPFRLFVDWLEPDQRDSQYEKQQTGAFHGQRNPVVTLDWRLPRDLPAGETQEYFAYFDIEQNAGEHAEHRKTEPEHPPDDMERLDGLYWVGAGTTVYGYYPESTLQNTMTVIATQQTDVRVYGYQGTTPRLDDRTEQDGPDPEFCLLCPDNPTRARSYSFGFNPTHFKVVADRPVTVLTHHLEDNGQEPDMTHVPEFVPSREGGTLGWTFDIPEVTGNAWIIMPPGGRAQVSVIGSQNNNCPSGEMGHPSRVTNCRVSLNIDADNQNVARLRTVQVDGDPVLVQFTPSRGVGHPAQVPSALGSPVGPESHAVTLSENCPAWPSQPGGFQVTAWGRDAFVDVTDPSGSSVFSAAEVAADPPAPQRMPGDSLAVQTCTPPPPGSPPPTWNTPFPYTVEAVEDPESLEATGPIQVRAGSFGGNPTVSQTTPFGGRHAMEFHVEGPFVIYNYYPTTRLTITHYEDGDRTVEQRTAGQRGLPVEYDVATDAVHTIEADKPVSVFPLGTPTNYARFHAAMPDFLEPEILPGHYRGYLIDVVPQDGLDPVFLTGLPGQVLDSTFQVRNLARWGDEPVGDVVRFSATVESRNWDGAATVGASFDQREMSLPDDTQRNNRISLDLPADVPSDTQLTVRVRAVSEGNPQMQQDFSIVVLVRQTFDVEMWFGEPTSVSGPGMLPLRIQEGTEQAIPFVIRNKGSGTDSFDLSFGAPEGGWSARITDPVGVPLSRVENLDPEQQVGALLHVRSPATMELTGVSIPVDAVSTTSALASDRIILSASLALAQDVELSADELSKRIAPGSTERFHVHLLNTGDDGLSIRMGLDAVLPDGWGIRFAGLGAPDQPPISLQPGGEVEVPIDVTAAEDASADDFVSFLLRAEGEGQGVEARDAISLSATVERDHLLEVAPVPQVRLTPAQPTTIEVTVTNRGNTPDEVRIEPVAIPGGWVLTPLNGTQIVGPGESTRMSIELQPVATQPPGHVELVLQARSGGPAFEFSVPVEVAAVHELAWDNVTTVLTQPGDSATTMLRLENRGNVAQRITLEVADALWDVELSTPSLVIPAGSSRPVLLGWQVPSSASEGETSLRVVAQAESGVTEEARIPVRIEEARLELDEVVLTTSPRGPGSVGTVTAIVSNPGGVAVKNAEVRLVGTSAAGEGPVVVDRVVFGSIGPDGDVVAPLRWVEGEDVRPGEVVWGKTQNGEWLQMGTLSMPADEADELVDRKGIPSPAVTWIVWFVLGVLGIAWIGRRSGEGDAFE